MPTEQEKREWHRRTDEMKDQWAVADDAIQYHERLLKDMGYYMRSRRFTSRVTNALKTLIGVTNNEIGRLTKLRNELASEIHKRDNSREYWEK